MTDEQRLKEVRNIVDRISTLCDQADGITCDISDPGMRRLARAMIELGHSDVTQEDANELCEDELYEDERDV